MGKRGDISQGKLASGLLGAVRGWRRRHWVWSERPPHRA